MIYEENIKNLKEISKNNVNLANDYEKAKRKTIAKIMNGYRDPNIIDAELYEKISNNLSSSNYKFKKDIKNGQLCLRLNDNPSMKLGCDAIIGLKTFFIVYRKDKNRNKWIEKYEALHANIHGTLLVPRDGGLQLSLNNSRYFNFRDRPDQMLADIAKAFEIINTQGLTRERIMTDIKNKCIMGRSLGKGETLVWLLTFANFKNFVDSLKLKWLVNDEYQVINIQLYNEETKPILEKATINRILPDKQYLENLLSLLKKA